MLHYNTSLFYIFVFATQSVLFFSKIKLRGNLYMLTPPFYLCTLYFAWNIHIKFGYCITSKLKTYSLIEFSF